MSMLKVPTQMLPSNSVVSLAKHFSFHANIGKEPSFQFCVIFCHL